MSEILSERIPLEVEGTPVSSIMIEKPFTCTQDCTISDVVRMLAENEVSSMPIIDERNHVVGFISDGDVMGAIAQHRAHTIFTGGDASMLYFDDQSLEQRIEDLKDRCVMDFATRKVVCARPDQSIARVAALLAKKKEELARAQEEAERLEQHLATVRQQKESEAEDAKMLLAWIYKTKVEVVG